MINKINARQSDQGDLFQDPKVDTPYCSGYIASLIPNEKSNVEGDKKWNGKVCFVAAIVNCVEDFLDETASARVLKQYLGDPE